ncbi:hypothetical protein ACF8PU_20380 [Pseudomonas sp. GLN_6]|uniref:hypothetical protein n=1 Tax=Pseudomonas sp. GLN_6 TaxID=3367183 RepID=UPI00370C91C7
MNGFQGDSVFMTVSSIDFNTCRISLHTKLIRELKPEECSLGAGSGCFVIDAPLGSACSGGEAGNGLHLESYARINQLEDSIFQLVFAALPAELSSDSWLETVKLFLRASLLDEGLLANGLENFLAVLSASSSRQLQCALISCTEPWEVPEEALKVLKFRTLYANLFGGEHLTLGMYAGLLDSVERWNPSLKASWLDMKIHDSAQPILLLLGEPEGTASM